MSSINTILTIAEVVGLINKIMRANFMAVDSELDAKIASLPWNDKIKVKQPSTETPTATPSEVQQWVQKAFMLLSDLIVTESGKESDMEAVKLAADSYIPMLNELVETMPLFRRLRMDPVQYKAYIAATKALDSRGWTSLKNDYVMCKKRIFLPHMSLYRKKTRLANSRYTSATGISQYFTVPSSGNAVSISGECPI